MFKEWLAQVSAGLSQGAIAMLLTLLAASGVHSQYRPSPLMHYDGNVASLHR